MFQSNASFINIAPENKSAYKISFKSNLPYTRGITQRRVTSGKAYYVSGLAPGQHSSEKTSQRWRTAGDAVSDLTGPGILRPPASIAIGL